MQRNRKKKYIKHLYGLFATQMIAQLLHFIVCYRYHRLPINYFVFTILKKENFLVNKFYFFNLEYLQIFIELS